MGSTLGKQNVYADRTVPGRWTAVNAQARTAGPRVILNLCLFPSIWRQCRRENAAPSELSAVFARQPGNCKGWDAHWIFPSIQALSAYSHFVARGRNCSCLDKPVRNRLWSVLCLVEGSLCNGCCMQICSSWSVAPTAPLAAFQPQAIWLIKEFLLWHWYLCIWSVRLLC